MVYRIVEMRMVTKVIYTKMRVNSPLSFGTILAKDVMIGTACLIMNCASCKLIVDGVVNDETTPQHEHKRVDCEYLRSTNLCRDDCEGIGIRIAAPDF